MRPVVLCLAALLIASPRLPAADDLESAFQSLKQAESEKDAAQVKQFAVQAHKLAREEASAAAPQEESEQEAWKARLAYLRSVESYSEYALFSMALQSPAAVTLELLETLAELNPKSHYLDEACGRYFLALQQTGAAARIPAVAEKLLADLPDNEDALLVLADDAMSRKQSDRALKYSQRLIAALGMRSKPESMTAADWERKRSAALGRAYWVSGMVHAGRGQHYETDRELRAALSLIQGDQNMMASALFFLGVANYELGRVTRNKARILEAAKFSEQAAAIKSSYAQDAWRNALIMKDEAAKMR